VSREKPTPTLQLEPMFNSIFPTLSVLRRVGSARVLTADWVGFLFEL